MTARILLLTAVACLAARGSPAGVPLPVAAAPGDTLVFPPAPSAPGDTLTFAPPAPARAARPAPSAADSELVGDEEWLRAPFGEGLLTDAEAWRLIRRRPTRFDLIADYNRVDPLRLGATFEAQEPGTFFPRLGARLEYATGRERWLYGAQLEQPLDRRGRYSVGFSMTRRTDHSELQQVEDVENSLALLFGRQDYRDYFEREGFGAYLAWRVPDFSVVSLHARNDTYRSLPLYRGTRSWFEQDRALRDNPPVDEGDVHAVLLRLERQARRTSRSRAGLYHWIEIERAGAGLGGDYAYTRALADFRSVLRLSPATTLILRLAGGHGAAGALPRQKQFAVGGVDGLRAHPFDEYRGDQFGLGQAEYTVGLWHLRASGLEAGLHAISFVDAGRAWSSPDHVYDIGRQHIEVDGGFGLATAEDNLRVYFARSLQRPRSGVVISARLQRPF